MNNKTRPMLNLSPVEIVGNLDVVGEGISQILLHLSRMSMSNPPESDTTATDSYLRDEERRYSPITSTPMWSWEQIADGYLMLADLLRFVTQDCAEKVATNRTGGFPATEPHHQTIEALSEVGTSLFLMGNKKEVSRDELSIIVTGTVAATFILRLVRDGFAEKNNLGVESLADSEEFRDEIGMRLAIDDLERTES